MKVWRDRKRKDPAYCEKMRAYSAGRKNKSYKERSRWAGLRYHDKKVGREFTLSFADFMRHAVSPCLYCGKEAAGGVDRLNSDIGHIPDNCVPCCYTCNKMKSALTLEEFVLHIEAIHSRIHVIADAV